MYLNAPLKGFPMQMGTGAWESKNYNDGATGPRKKFDDIFSQLDTIHDVTDRQTDEHRVTAKTALMYSFAR